MSNTWMEHELERYREDEKRRLEDERLAREQRKREREEVYEERLRSASTWPEALQNQAVLMGREARFTFEGDDDTYFSSGERACYRALELWKEEETRRQNDISELQKRIANIYEEIKQDVGYLLRKESDEDGWQEVARALEEETDLELWLCW